MARKHLKYPQLPKAWQCPWCGDAATHFATVSCGFGEQCIQMHPTIRCCYFCIRVLRAAVGPHSEVITGRLNPDGVTDKHKKRALRAAEDIVRSAQKKDNAS